MNSGFVMMGDVAVRASDVVRLTPLIEKRGNFLAYGVRADLRYGDRYVTYSIGECHVDDRSQAEEETSLYMANLMVYIRNAEIA